MSDAPVIGHAHILGSLTDVCWLSLQGLHSTYMRHRPPVQQRALLWSFKSIMLSRSPWGSSGYPRYSGRIYSIFPLDCFPGKLEGVSYTTLTSMSRVLGILLASSEVDGLALL